MDTAFFLYLGRYTLQTAMLLVAPLLIIALGVGLVVTLLQAVTSIKDMTLTIVPKLLAMGVALLIFGNWMLQVVLKFTAEVFGYIQNVGQ